MTEGRIRPVKVLRRPQLVMVTKFVMMTSSFGIIISARNSAKTTFFPGKSRRAKAKAAKRITTSMMAVVARVKIRVFVK